MKNTSNDKLEILMKIPAIADAIRAFEDGEYSASLEQRLAAIDKSKTTMVAEQAAREAESRAADERDRIRALLDIELLKYERARSATASATQASGAALKALCAAGESDLFTGIRRLGSWIESMEAEIQRLKTGHLRPVNQYAQVSFENISAKAARGAFLESELPFCRQKLNDLLALRFAPVSPAELKLTVRRTLESAGLPDVEMLAAAKAQQIIKEGSTGSAALLSVL